MPSSKAARRRLKLKIDFELNPPRCGSCEFHSREVFGHPTGKQYEPPYCMKHNIAVRAHSICNDWVHLKTGETLETSSGETK